MRKLTALIMAIAFILLPLSAADLSETGVGSTREEAIAAADAALAQRIAMTTTSEMRTIRADDGSDSVDFMVVNGRSFYSTEFLGSSFETEQLADGTWIATRTIPESSYRLYQKRLRESASIINDIYDGIELFGIDRESYTRIYSQLREYERNAVIVSMLRSNASIPEIPTNSVDIEAMYQSYLAESINATEQDVRRLEVQRELGIIGEAERTSLDEATARLESARLEQQALQEAQRMEAEAELEVFRKARTQEIALYSLNIAPVDSSADSAGELINEVEAMSAAFSEYRAQMEAIFSDLDARFDEEADSAESEIRSKPYYSYEKGLLGLPTKEAREARDEEVRSARRALNERYYAEGTKAFAEAVPPLVRLSQLGQEAMERLNESHFFLSTPSSAMTTRVFGFDLETLSWHGEAMLTIGSDSITLPFEIPLWEWLGIEPEEGESYYSYRDEINEWSNILSSYPYSYSIRLDYDIKAYSDQLQYILIVSDFEIRRTDTNRVVCSSEEPFRIAFGSGSFAVFDHFGFEYVSSDYEGYPSQMIDSAISSYRGITEEGEIRRAEELRKAEEQRKAEERRALEEKEEQERQEAMEASFTERDMVELLGPNMYDLFVKGEIGDLYPNSGRFLDGSRFMLGFGSGALYLPIAGSGAIMFDVSLGLDSIAIADSVRLSIHISPTYAFDPVAAYGNKDFQLGLGLSVDGFVPLTPSSAVELSLMGGVGYDEASGASFIGYLSAGYTARYGRAGAYENGFVYSVGGMLSYSFDTLGVGAYVKLSYRTSFTKAL